MMELRHLRYFLAVAEELHFTRAAKRLGMAQPPLSQQIAALEAELGYRLFERSRRAVALTPAGVVFRAEAQRVLRVLEAGVDAARQVASGADGVLRVGFATSVAFRLLPELMRRRHATHPRVQLHLHELPSAEQFGPIRDGSLTLGLARATAPGAGLVAHPVLEERFLVALPANSPLARRRRVEPRMLADASFIVSRRAAAPDLYDEVLAVCADGGIAPRVVQEATEWSTVLALVHAGLGIALVPESVRVIAYENVVLRELRGTSRRSVVSVVVQEERADEPLVRDFIASAVASARELK